MKRQIIRTVAVMLLAISSAVGVYASNEHGPAGSPLESTDYNTGSCPSSCTYTNCTSHGCFNANSDPCSTDRSCGDPQSGSCQTQFGFLICV